jgi:CheY-like chemotaxis protein
MPGLSGLDVCRALRADHFTLPIPIVLVTGHARPADLGQDPLARVDACLTKPFSPLDLLRLVERFLPSGEHPLNGTRALS